MPTGPQAREGAAVREGQLTFGPVVWARLRRLVWAASCHLAETIMLRRVSSGKGCHCSLGLRQRLGLRLRLRAFCWRGAPKCRLHLGARRLQAADCSAAVRLCCARGCGQGAPRRLSAGGARRHSRMHSRLPVALLPSCRLRRRRAPSARAPDCGPSRRRAQKLRLQLAARSLQPPAPAAQHNAGHSEGRANTCQ